MKHIAFLVVLLAAFINTGYGQDFRITSNDNQYFSVKHYHKKDSNSVGKFVIMFTVSDSYVSTLVNPKFSWNDGSGTLESKMIAPGKYQIDLPVCYKKTNTNCITINEFNTPRSIDVEIGNIQQQLLKIEYLSNLSREDISDRISRFNPVEAKHNDLIDFLYGFNSILRQYDPFCELILPEVATGEFSKKITTAINTSWERTRVKLFYSLCDELSKTIKKDRKLKADMELIACLSKANIIKLNYYNACQIEFLVDLMESILASPESRTTDTNKLIVNSFNALKSENLDSTNRFLVVANIVKNGYLQNNLLVAYTPASFRNLDDKKSPRGYFSCPSSPSFRIFPEAVCILWAENKKKEKASINKLVDIGDARYKEIVFPLNGSLAIVRLPDNFNKSLKIPDFCKDLDQLIIKYNCLFLYNISIPLY